MQYREWIEEIDWIEYHYMSVESRNVSIHSVFSIVFSLYQTLEFIDVVCNHMPYHWSIIIKHFMIKRVQFCEHFRCIEGTRDEAYITFPAWREWNVSVRIVMTCDGPFYSIRQGDFEILRHYITILKQWHTQR